MAGAGRQTIATGLAGLFGEASFFDQCLEVFPGRLDGAKAEGLLDFPDRWRQTGQQSFANEFEHAFAGLSGRSSSHRFPVSVFSQYHTFVWYTTSISRCRIFPGCRRNSIIDPDFLLRHELF